MQTAGGCGAGRAPVEELSLSALQARLPGIPSFAEFLDRYRGACTSYDRAEGCPSHRPKTYCPGVAALVSKPNASARLSFFGAAAESVSVAGRVDTAGVFARGKH